MCANCSYTVNLFQISEETWKKTVLLLGYETAIAIYHSRFYTDLYHSLEVKGQNFCPQPKKPRCAMCTEQ